MKLIVEQVYAAQVKIYMKLTLFTTSRRRGDNTLGKFETAWGTID